jgi:hypothetical protein
MLQLPVHLRLNPGVEGESPVAAGVGVCESLEIRVMLQLLRQRQVEQERRPAGLDEAWPPPHLRS